MNTDIYGKGGVYEIRHIDTNEAYCGRASNLGLRRDNHFGQLKRGKHRNRFLQSAYNNSNKLEDSLCFRVLEFIDEIEQQIIKEQWLIDSGNYIYNIKGNAQSGGAFRRHVIYEYHTPWGVFSTTKEAAISGVMSGSTVSMHCQFPEEKIKRANFSKSQFLQQNFDESIIEQKTWRDLGFGFRRYHVKSN